MCCIAGFDGVYTNKAGKVREGCATFFRRRRLRLLSRRDVVLKDCFRRLDCAAAVDSQMDGPNPEGAGPAGQLGGHVPVGWHAAGGAAARHARFDPLLRASPGLTAALKRVATVAQLCLLQARRPSVHHEDVTPSS
jgi:2',5'-phosphodiesterase